MTAIARITGANIPLTPAAAAGGRAYLGGYYPHQAHTDKGAGRSTPYPHSSSSGSSWWASTQLGQLVMVQLERQELVVLNNGGDTK